MSHERILILVLIISSTISAAASAQQNPVNGPEAQTPSYSSSALDTIPAGTKITLQNWREYQRFMPDGMVALFERKYFWKMPPDIEIEVGPTVVHQLPPNYVAATEKYSSGVKLIALPDGALTLKGYMGGQPFPAPTEPHKGWKILANVWYRYLPHLAVSDYGTRCIENSLYQTSCSAARTVYRQLSFNTDPGVPPTIPGAAGKFYAIWQTILEPEQQKYDTLLVNNYADLARPGDAYIFAPELRHAVRVNASGRCAPYKDTDATPDDYRVGFDSDIGQYTADLVGERRILALIGVDIQHANFPADYDMPLGWPKPFWGKWQLRDVYVISVRKLPALQASYCLGKRVMYVDKTWYGPLWEDLYDSKMRPWKFSAMFLNVLKVPHVGLVETTASQIWPFWDIQGKHATFLSDPAPDHSFYVNGQAPRQYNDIVKYTTPEGLLMIMK